MNITTIYFLYQQFGGLTYKWKTLQHNGVLFPPPYQPHNTPLYYNDKPYQLPKEIEEIATIFSSFIGTEYLENKIFIKNFWNDFKKMLSKHGLTEITDYEKANFIEIRKVYEKRKLETKIPQDSEKYKTCMIDGKEQPVGNFRVELPGVFRGRGENKSLGKIKRRMSPKDFILNLSKDSPIPEIPEQFGNEKWGKIVHDRTVDWLVSWKDPVSEKTKYVWLGSESEIKGQKDMEKYEKARKLKKKVKIIRETYLKDMSSTDEKIRQCAVAIYMIDNFALRVGSEKGDSDTADTVGVTMLRIEHITFLENNKIKLDFLGKDSIRYLNILEVEPIVYQNLSALSVGKTKNDELFDKIKSTDVNKYLQEFMPELTAKVFRTYNASNLFSNELKKITNKFETYLGNDKIKLLLEEYNKANIKVAQLCNHQKKVSKNFSTQIEKIDEQIKELKSKGTDKSKDKIKELKKKKELKSEMKNIALGTSKINYIDPRITIAFIKKHNIPLEKLFSKALMEKFKWAFAVDENYKF